MSASPRPSEQSAVPVFLTHIEIAGTLAALRAVLDIAPQGKPQPLLDAETKLEEALRA